MMCMVGEVTILSLNQENASSPYYANIGRHYSGLCLQCSLSNLGVSPGAVAS